MKLTKTLFLFFTLIGLLSSCISKTQFEQLQKERDMQNEELGLLGEELSDQMKLLAACNQDKEKLKGDIRTSESALKSKDEQINDLKDQINDLRLARNQTVEQVGDLTVLSQSANDNIKETLSQLEGKDKYIQVLQAAKTKADSINLALAVNLTSELSQGIADKDIEVKVDKTVVFINLSDKMLYQSGSAEITSRATEVLGKIATIVKARPNLEVMVEGYTDNLPINKPGIKDNWDLSVLRATSVVRALQTTYNIDPNRLIAAGRGQYNALASNDTLEGRSMNRRTRIIILPKIDQFYDLLNPDNVPK